MTAVVPVVERSQIAEARRRCMAMAAAAGFDQEATARVALVATELATNLVRHGSGGEMLVDSYEDASGSGVDLIAVDRGPGIADVQACLRDGYSTAGGPGTGLGAVARQSQTFEILSQPGLGTVVLARVASGPATAASRIPPWGIVCTAMPGEAVCGDACSVVVDRGRRVFLVADGLGHGPAAAEASTEAVRTFRRLPNRSPGAILEAVHAALRPTRGAAVAIAQVDSGTVRFAGIGNIAGTVVSGGKLRRMVSHNGIAGHQARRVQEFEYPFDAASLLVMHSDGLTSSWTLDRYPGLAVRHPMLAAALLYRDFARGRDDLCIVVAAGSPP